MPAVRTDDRHGVVYTPPPVARPMVERALAPLIAGRGADELLALRVCDPAVGEGAFLVEVIAVLAEAVAAARRREGHPLELAVATAQVAARCVLGIDVDARAVGVARRRLGLGAQALRVGDALALAGDGARFDAVVGNPPYIRQESLGAAAKAAVRGFASYDGAADLYVYFFELAHRIVRPGGRYCLIAPNKWLTAAYGRPLRAFLAAQGSVEDVVDLSRARLFGGADAFPAIVSGTVGGAGVRPLHAARIDEPDVPVADALRDRGTPHDRARWRDGPWHIDAPADRALIDRLERAFPPLGAVVPARPSRGVVTGCNRAFVLDAAARDRLLAREPAAAALIRPFVKGRDLTPWAPPAPARWILLVDRGTSLDELPAVRAHLARFRAALEPKPARGPGPGRKPGAYRWYELQDPVGPLVASRAPRLLYQDIQTAPVCCLDRSGALVPDTTVWMLPTDDLVVLAILRSSLYRWYARQRFPPALNGSVRPKQAYLRALPIAQPPPAARAALEQLVEQRLAAADPRLDAAIDDAVLAAYDLTAAERAQLRK